ncbi:SsgA family sporulation/cell division regulator [Streptomyces sp. NPDC002835]
MTHDEPTFVPSQRSTAWLCTTHLLLHAITADRTVPVRACLAYSADDPYTVYLDSHTDAKTPVTWALSRELLTTGTKRRAGAGDVLVYPGSDADSVYLLLADRGTGTGDALLRAQASDVEAFLRWSERIVPPGRESEYLDMDALIEQLLGQDPPV